MLLICEHNKQQLMNCLTYAVILGHLNQGAKIEPQKVDLV